MNAKQAFQEGCRRYENGLGIAEALKPCATFPKGSTLHWALNDGYALSRRGLAHLIDWCIK